MPELIPFFEEPLVPLTRRLRRWMDDPLWMREEADGDGLAMDIYKDEEAQTIVAKASLPGFAKDEIDVQIEGGVLSINGEHEESTEDRGDKYYRRERRVGHMHRRVALPGPLKDGDAKAELSDGVLVVTVPIAEEAQGKRVDVKLA